MRRALIIAKRSTETSACSDVVCNAKNVKYTIHWEKIRQKGDTLHMTKRVILTANVSGKIRFIARKILLNIFIHAIMIASNTNNTYYSSYDTNTHVSKVSPAGCAKTAPLVGESGAEPRIGTETPVVSVCAGTRRQCKPDMQALRPLSLDILAVGRSLRSRRGTLVGGSIETAARRPSSGNGRIHDHSHPRSTASTSALRQGEDLHDAPGGAQHHALLIHGRSHHQAPPTLLRSDIEPCTEVNGHSRGPHTTKTLCAGSGSCRVITRNR